MTDFYLEGKPDLEESLQRIKAWYFGEMIDRPPVNFTSWGNTNHDFLEKTFISDEERWMDGEYAVDRYINTLEDIQFIGESYPIFIPNIGPSVYSAFFGGGIEFEPSTTWLKPCIKDWNDLDKLKFDYSNSYFKKIEETAKYASEKGKNKFLLGFTDIHPGLDAVSAWRDPQELCYDLYDEPEEVIKAVKKATEPFARMMEKFHKWSKPMNKNFSVSWMGIPFEGKMHIPSCDFAAMISNSQFEKFAMPALKEEVQAVDYNIFHVDGKGVANHLDLIMSLPNTNALQWVQGAGETQPIMQWIPLIKRMREGGKSVVVYLEPNELDEFMERMSPKGIMLSLYSNDIDEKKMILKKLENWR